jgi:hypothetical protein
VCIGLRRAQADRRAPGPADVDDPFTPLALDLTVARKAQRLEQPVVELQAPVEVGDDEIEVVDGLIHRHRR